ncbi:gfo/Idh/MocA family oxidoreductase [Mycetocola tolaasinivorans]|uniref:Gfo/Idh/MocA family oxidoreductase n=1 Tax=Mycetocola tolaasinivorans TaxID=76635 RepID=A0A3L7A898_9MICO|nr:Gfo/Idh/MocA family oxidoreductase [Mycetocola tolaasinivorans]RLP75592.1 gfo/Idh/MocA family oxidoreductase [Mycetocola tolaasinivorans]
MNHSPAAPVRIGVLGLGAVAQAVHLPLMSKRPDLVTIAGICDLSTDLTTRIGERFGVPAEHRYSSYADMLAHADLDAVMILSRGSHAEAVLEAFDHRLAVFCEKPLAFTLAEVDEMIAREPDLGHPAILLAYMKQYDPAVLEAARLLRDIDDVRSIEAMVLHPTGASQLAFAHVQGSATPLPDAALAAADAEDRRLWAAAVGDAEDAVWRSYRGSLVASLAHDLSILRSFGAPATTIDHADIWRQSSAHAVRDVGRDRKSFGEHPPSILAIGPLAGGGRVSLGWQYLPDFPAYRETVRVVHGRGSIELTFPSPYLMHAPTELTITALDGTTEKREVRRDITEAFETQLEAFHNMVRHGVAPLSGLADGRADILTCQRIVAAYAERVGINVGGEVGERIAEIRA